MPSPTVDTILAPASPNRLQAQANVAATSHPSVARNPRRAPSLDSSPVGAKSGSSPDLGRSASAPATLDTSLSPQLIRHPCVNGHSQDRVPRGPPSHPQPSTCLAPSARVAASNARSSRDNTPSLDRSPFASLDNAPVSGPILPEFSHGAWLPRLGVSLSPTPFPDSIPFSSSSIRTVSQGSTFAVPDVIPSALSSAYSANTTASPYAGLSPSLGPGPVLVSRPAPPTTATSGIGASNKAPRFASIKSVSTFSALQAACPPPHSAPHLDSGSFSPGAFPTATSAPPPGPVSPLHLGASATPLPALSGSVSGGAPALPQPGSDTVESLRQQLSFLVQAWMADRESSRPAKQQTEEVLQRMHVAMESGREQWTNDRAAMERDLESLSAQVQRLKLENAALKAAAARAKQGQGVVSPKAGRRHDGGSYARTGNSSPSNPDHPTAASLSSNPSQQSGSSRAYIFSPPSGFDDAPRRPHFATPGSSRTSPSGPPIAVSHVGPLDPRSQPQHSVAVDFMDPLPQSGKVPPPIIDVREIDPRLEGIPLRANAVQKSTFTASTPYPSFTVFTRRGGEGRDTAASRRARRFTPTRNLSVDRSRLWRLKRTSSKDHTLQVLAAEESRRLTMHAGHTPNHSLSLLPTMTITGGDSTACESVQATSSVESRSLCADHDAHAHSDGLRDDETLERHAELDQDALGDSEERWAGPVGHPELELLEDKPLKGPLMVKNIPAQDDIFFAKLDRKLECVKSGQDALPSVLREPSPVRKPRCGSPGVITHPRQPMPAPASGGDTSNGTSSTRGSVDEGEPAEEQLEADVPLKMRNTSNFGAPFGSA